MTNASKKFGSIVFALIFATGLSSPGFAIASDGYEGGGFDGGYTGGGYDGGYTGGGYDGGYTGGGYDGGYTGGGYDGGYTGGGYDGGYTGGGYDGGYTGGGYDGGYTGGGYDGGYTGGGYDGGYTGGGYDGGYTGGGYSGGGYSSGGSGQSFSGGSFRGFSGGGFTITPPAPVSTPPIYIPQPPHYTPPTYTPPSNTNVTNTTNTCVNNSCNNTSTVTNINQTPQQPYYPVVYQQQPAPYCSITIVNNGYGYYNQNATLTWTSSNATSAYISGVGTVSTYGTRQVYGNGGTVYTMTVSGAGGTANCQTQVTYYPTPVPAPIPQPIPSNLYCQIYASPTAVQNGQAAYLSWSSTGATYATLSDGIGNVAPNGSLAVRPEASRNYVLTVYGYGGSRTCNASVTVIGSSVSLTQIPYTGFDFGATGNAIYWMSILAFAASLAYLALYFQGGALAIAGGALRSNKKAYTMTPAQTIKVPAPTPAVIQMPAAQAPVVVAKKAVEIPLAAIAEFRTNDQMTLIQSKEGGAPRLVITRG